MGYDTYFGFSLSFENFDKASVLKSSFAPKLE